MKLLTHLLKTEKAVDISTEDYKHLLKYQEEMISLMRTIITQQQSPIQNRNTPFVQKNICQYYVKNINMVLI